MEVSTKTHTKNKSHYLKLSLRETCKMIPQSILSDMEVSTITHTKNKLHHLQTNNGDRGILMWKKFLTHLVFKTLFSEGYENFIFNSSQLKYKGIKYKNYVQIKLFWCLLKKKLLYFSIAQNLYLYIHYVIW